MQWHINDVSLAGQFPDAHAFLTELNLILNLRSRVGVLRQGLLCSRILSNRLVTPNLTFRQAVTAQADPNFKRLVLGWLTREGPFWDDKREVNSDDYFEFAGQDVTDTGLGEAARRTLAGTEAHSFSFDGCPLPCSESPLVVQHGLIEEPLGHVRIPNLWQAEQLERAAQAALPPPQTWPAATARLRERFGDRLLIEVLAG